MTDRDRIRVFRGMNVAVHSSLLSSGESPDMVNLECRDGKAAVRPGMVVNSSLSMSGLLGSIRRVMRIIPFVIPGEHEIEESAVILVAEPGDGAPPGEDDDENAMQPWDFPGEDGRVRIWNPDRDEENVPDGAWVVGVSLPAQVYVWCSFDLALTAEGTGTFDGTDAALVPYVLRSGYMSAVDPDLLTSGDVAPDPTSGWSANLWTASVRVSNAEIGRYKNLLSVECLVDGHRGIPGTAELLYPVMYPVVEDEEKAKLPESTEMEIKIECHNVEGDVLSTYANAGDAVGLSFRLFNFNTGSWATATVVQADDSPIDLTTGWSSGVWTKSVKFDADELSTASIVEMIVGSDLQYDYGVAWELRGNSELVFDVSEIEPDTPWNVTIRVFNPEGTINTEYDGADSGLYWYGYDEESWTLLEGDDVPVLLSDAAIDVTDGWVSGVWSAAVKMKNNLFASYTKIKALHKIGSMSSGYDTADLEDVYSRVVNAIYERQLAGGIAFDWSESAPLSTGRFIQTDKSVYEYDLSNLRTYVNELGGATGLGYVTPTYVPWVAGPTEPEVLSSDYANSATTLEELYELVRVLRRRKVDISLSKGDYKYGHAFVVTTLQAAKNECEEEYLKNTWSPQRGVKSQTKLYQAEDGEISSVTAVSTSSAFVLDETPKMACTFSVYSMACCDGGSDQYDVVWDDGWDLPEEDQYKILLESSVEANQADETVLGEDVCAPMWFFNDGLPGPAPMAPWATVIPPSYNPATNEIYYGVSLYNYGGLLTFSFKYT